jgi:hypothetical protein
LIDEAAKGAVGTSLERYVLLEKVGDGQSVGPKRI